MGVSSLKLHVVIFGGENQATPYKLNKASQVKWNSEMTTTFWC